MSECTHANCLVSMMKIDIILKKIMSMRPMKVGSSSEILKIVLFLKCISINKTLFGDGPHSDEFMRTAIMITYWKLDRLTIERWDKFSGGVFFANDTLCHLLTFLQGEVEYYQMYEGRSVEEAPIGRFCPRCEDLYRTTMANDRSAQAARMLPPRNHVTEEDPARAARIAAARGAARTAAACSAPDPADGAAAAANVEEELPPLLARFAQMFSDKTRNVMTRR